MVHGGVYKPVYVHLCVCMCIHVGGLAAFWMHGRWNQKAGVDWCVRSPQPSLTQTQGNTWQSPQDWLWDTSMSYQKELHSQGCSRDLCVPALGKAQDTGSPSIPPHSFHALVGRGAHFTQFISSGLRSMNSYYVTQQLILPICFSKEAEYWICCSYQLTLGKLLGFYLLSRTGYIVPTTSMWAMHLI